MASTVSTTFFKKAGKGYSEGRAAARRRADYQIETGTAPRERLTDEEATKFLESIRTNYCSPFGVVTLSRFDVDQLLPRPRSYTPYEERVTMISFAAFMERGQILQMLLRGGSNFLIRACKPDGTMCAHHAKTATGEKVQELRRFFNSFGRVGSRYVPWIMIAVARMRTAGCDLIRRVEMGELEQSEGACVLCQGQVGCQPIAWTGCGHLMCEECMWSRLLCPHRYNTEIRCPACGYSEEDSADCTRDFFDSLRELGGRHPDHAKTRAECCEKYEELPLKPGAKEHQIHRRELRKFKSAQLAVARGLYLGTTKSSRKTSWIEAAHSGDVHRILAVARAGVDVDLQDEYGHTAVFTAAFNDHVEALRLLVGWAGCDPDIPAGGGCTPLGMAVATGKRDVAELLRAYGARECLGISEGLVHGEGQDGLVSEQLSVRVLIPTSEDHPGAGAMVIDGAFDEMLLGRLDQLVKQLPIHPPEKKSCSDRLHYCDSEGWISQRILAVVRMARDMVGSEYEQAGCPFPDRPLDLMRFLYYRTVGSELPPHTDLSRRDPISSRRSHFTFIVYTEDCDAGGETVLMKSLVEATREREEKRQAHVKIHGKDVEFVMEYGPDNDIEKVTPRRGRLLLFPHMCPHRGAVVTAVPKVLIRGEVMGRILDGGDNCGVEGLMGERDDGKSWDDPEH